MMVNLFCQGTITWYSLILVRMLNILYMLFGNICMISIRNFSEGKDNISSKEHYYCPSAKNNNI